MIKVDSRIQSLQNKSKLVKLNFLCVIMTHQLVFNVNSFKPECAVFVSAPKTCTRHVGLIEYCQAVFC